jgi:hypothetical protein
MRRFLASCLLLTSKALVPVMAVLSGLGAFIALVVLTISGDISIVGAIALFFIGLPVVEGLAYIVTMGVTLAMMGIAKLFDRQAVTEFLDAEGY